MHINVRPLDRHQAYMTESDAIAHLWIFGKFAKDWEGVHFGRDIAAIRKINESIKAKDVSAFQAFRRKGFWRIELKGA